MTVNMHLWLYKLFLQVLRIQEEVVCVDVLTDDFEDILQDISLVKTSPLNKDTVHFFLFANLQDFL